jgi:hypothetical protein
MFKRLVIGAIVGGAVAWAYKDRIPHDIDNATLNIRERLAARLDAAAERVDGIAKVVEEGLHEAARRLNGRGPRPALAGDAGIHTTGKPS